MVVMVHSLPDGAQSSRTGFIHVRVAFTGFSSRFLDLSLALRLTATEAPVSTARSPIPIFIVIIKLIIKLPPLLIFSLTALVETVHVATGWMVIDEFCAIRPNLFRPSLPDDVFALSDRARAYPILGALALSAPIDGSQVAVGDSELLWCR